jgi:gamma-glutamylcyclotransferase (GGCT)/AIG2-like uncharacterized protein YtfP
VTLYAAYGSNLDPRRMAQRAPSSPVRGSGWLRGWRLTFAGEELGWDGSLSTVVEDAQASVFVMLYEMTAQDERALDAWEGVELGLWTKIKVRVQTMGRQELAWIYVLDAYEGGLPSAHYLGVLAEAAEAGGAPAEYVERLRLLPCRSIDGTDYSAD